MVHESRLIQFFTHKSRLNKKKITSGEHEKILLSLITTQEQGKIQITIHEEKKTRPSMLHVKSIGVLLSITEADSEQVLFISSNT